MKITNIQKQVKNFPCRIMYKYDKKNMLHMAVAPYYSDFMHQQEGDASK